MADMSSKQIASQRDGVERMTREAERERCARVVESYEKRTITEQSFRVLEIIAAKIRSGE